MEQINLPGPDDLDHVLDLRADSDACGVRGVRALTEDLVCQAIQVSECVCWQRGEARNFLLPAGGLGGFCPGCTGHGAGGRDGGVRHVVCSDAGVLLADVDEPGHLFLPCPAP